MTPKANSPAGFAALAGSLSHVQITPAVETGMEREAERAESSICAGSSTVELPLFQGDDGGSSPTSALQFTIRKINLPTATKFVERWHYSQQIPGGQVVCFGLFADGSLYATIVYGMGCNRFQASFLGVKTFMEIKRMCRREPKMNYELSRFIAITARFLRREYAFECLLAFADPEHGHEGHVYKAAGFVLHGETQAEWHLEDANGRRVHRRLAHRWAKNAGVEQEEIRQKHGLTRVRTLPKYRWVKMVGRAAGAGVGLKPSPTEAKENESSSATGSAGQPPQAGEARVPSLFAAAHGSANCERHVRNEVEREAGAEPEETNL